MTYRIVTDATADLNEELLAGLPEAVIIPMNIKINETEYLYGPGGNISIKEFYDKQREGNFATTSQITPTTFIEYFKAVLEQGMDLLYLAFSSGLSGTYQSSCIAANELRNEFPDRTIVCIDTLCASAGEGFFVHEALVKQACGYSLEELEAWVLENRLKVCHWFSVDIFDHLKHGGRVSAAAATMGSVLNIKPLLHVDTEGKLQVTEKNRGWKKAMLTQIAHIKDGWTPQISPFVLIAHGDCPERALELKEKVTAVCPDARIAFTEIGPVIGSHTGPGMLAILYWGNNR